MLNITGLGVQYGDFLALSQVDMSVDQGSCVSLVGANGAGKSTLLRAVMGSLRKTAGSVVMNGRDITCLPPHEVVKSGVSIVPEGRKLFGSLSVEENLLIGSESKNSGDWNLERVYTLFPDLKAKRRVLVPNLSGGQQQMVSIGRSLMTNPKLILCDEISLGLSPKVIRDIYEAIPRIRREGISIVIVEQDLNLAIQASSYLYCLREGQIVLHGKSQNLTREQISEAYFGIEHV